jgi:SulP family sulfate permease
MRVAREVAGRLPTWLTGYRRSWLRGDVIAGVTVTAYLIPQVMAYAELAGLPAVTGLWGVIGGLVLYSLVGTSRKLSVGPESTTSLMTAAAIGAVASTQTEYVSFAVALCFVVAAYCLIAGVAGLGLVSDLLSRPVLVGYMAGVAGVMVASQLDKLTGLDVEGEDVAPQIWYVITHADAIHVPTLVLGLATAALMLLGSWRWARVPVALIGMLAATAMVAAFGLADRGVEVVGQIPAGLPRPALPDVTAAGVVEMLLPALGVTFVAFSDNILTARAFAADDEHIDPRRELFALGAANIGAGAFQAFPVSSSGSRTAIASAVGAHSQLYGVVTVGCTIVALLVARPVLEQFPMAALGAVVVYAATRLVEVPEFRRFGRFRRSELVLSLGTTAAVLVLGVLEGILVAIALSVADLLRRVARPHDSVLGFVPEVAGMHDVDDYPDAETVPGLMVYRYDSPLFFANADDFKHRALRAVEEAEEPVRWFVLNAEANIEVDITATDGLEDLRQSLADRDIVFAMARVKQDLRDQLARTGFIDRVGDERIFPTLPTAVEAYEKATGRSRPE